MKSKNLFICLLAPTTKSLVSKQAGDALTAMYQGYQGLLDSR